MCTFNHVKEIICIIYQIEFYSLKIFFFNTLRKNVVTIKTCYNYGDEQRFIDFIFIFFFKKRELSKIDYIFVSGFEHIMHFIFLFV